MTPLRRPRCTLLGLAFPLDIYECYEDHVHHVFANWQYFQTGWSSFPYDPERLGVELSYKSFRLIIEDQLEQLRLSILLESCCNSRTRL
jgi:hypothetical protein